MLETFHRSTGVTPDDLARLGQKNNRLAMSRAVIHFGLLGGSMAAVVLLSNSPWWILAPAIVLCGLMITCCFAPLHECSHRTAFASRVMNDRVAWLAGLPLLFPPAAYREFHFEHHRHTHDPLRDPEISAGGERFAMWPVYAHEYLAVASGVLLLSLRMVMLIALVVGPNEWLWQKLMPFMRGHTRKEATRQARIFAALYLAGGVLAAWLAPGAVWLLASLVVGHSALALWLASEHTGLPTDGNIFDRTRTTLTNRVMRFLMWNMPFHAEHHAYPSVPFHALPELHALARDELRHTAPGYVRLHRGVVQRLHWWPRDVEVDGAESSADHATG